MGEIWVTGDAAGAAKTGEDGSMDTKRTMNCFIFRLVNSKRSLGFDLVRTITKASEEKEGHY